MAANSEEDESSCGWSQRKRLETIQTFALSKSQETLSVSSGDERLQLSPASPISKMQLAQRQMRKSSYISLQHSGDMTELEDSALQVETLFKAVQYGRSRVVETLLDEGCDIDVTDPLGQTPLIKCCYLEKEDSRTHIVRILVKNGADINIQDIEGHTVLMLACTQSYNDIVKRLLQCRNLDASLSDNSGDTALIHAVKAGNTNATSLLLHHQSLKMVVDVNKTNNDGLSALMLALHLRHLDCVKVLVHEGNADTSVVRDKEALQSILDEDDKHLAKLNPTHVHLSAKSTPLKSSNIENQNMKKLKEEGMFPTIRSAFSEDGTSSTTRAPSEQQQRKSNSVSEGKPEYLVLPSVQQQQVVRNERIDSPDTVLEDMESSSPGPTNQGREKVTSQSTPRTHHIQAIVKLKPLASNIPPQQEGKLPLLEVSKRKMSSSFPDITNRANMVTHEQQLQRKSSGSP